VTVQFLPHPRPALAGLGIVIYSSHAKAFKRREAVLSEPFRQRPNFVIILTSQNACAILAADFAADLLPRTFVFAQETAPRLTP
jgi:hypothetical protein